MSIYENIGITQEQILEKYLGEFIPGKSISSPFRDERNPSFRVNYKDGHLVWFDFGLNQGGDALDFLIHHPLLPPQNIKEAVSFIRNEFKTFQIFNDNSNRLYKYKRNRSENNNICIKFDRNWYEYELSYWKRLNGDINDLNFFNIFPCAGIYYGLEAYLPSELTDPTFLYLFSKKEEIWKTYKPLTKDPAKKWRSNNISGHIQGYDLLPNRGEICVITSSYKDIFTWFQLGIPAIATHNENIIVQSPILADLRSRFKYIIANMNNDTTGMKSNRIYQKEYGIPVFHIPHTKALKGLSDPSDVVMHRDKKTLVQLFKDFARINKIPHEKDFTKSYWEAKNGAIR